MRHTDYQFTVTAYGVSSCASYPSTTDMMAAIDRVRELMKSGAQNIVLTCLSAERAAEYRKAFGVGDK